MNPQPIGIFDSGVGGLTVFKALETALPHESFAYLGDTARVPYGTRSSETVVQYSLEAARFLKQREIKLLVVACNTASSVAIDVLADEVGVPVLGVIEPGARHAVEETRSGRIGVIGTRATVASEAYTRAIRALHEGADVVSRACPLFVPLAEEGWVDNDVARATAEVYLETMKQASVDTLVLGCTHYPLLKPVIGDVMGEGVTLVDSAESVAHDVLTNFERQPNLASGSADAKPDHHFFVTDTPAPFQTVAERFLGRPITRLEKIHL